MKEEEPAPSVAEAPPALEGQEAGDLEVPDPPEPSPGSSTPRAVSEDVWEELFEECASAGASHDDLARFGAGFL